MSSRRKIAVRAVVVLALAAAGVLGTDLEHGRSAPPEAAAIGPCDVVTLPTKPVDVVGGLVGIDGPDEVCKKVTGGVTGAVGGAAADVAGQIGGSIVEELARKAGEGAIWLMGRAKEFALQSTSPDVLNPAFAKKYEQMFALALVPALIMLLVVAIECVARSDTGLLVRTALVTTPVAMLTAAAAMAVVQLLIAGVDSMSQGISADSGADIGRFLDRASDAMGATVGVAAHAGASVGGAPGAVSGGAAAAAVPVFIGLVGAVLAVIAALILWLELLFRSAAIYAVALFVPFAVMGVIWPRARAWMTRTVELILVLVFSKFVIVAILSLAGALVIDAGEFAVVLQATMLMLLAAFSPLMLLRLVPFVENAAGAVSHRSSGSVAYSGVRSVSNGRLIHSAAQRNWRSSPSAGDASIGSAETSGAVPLAEGAAGAGAAGGPMMVAGAGAAVAGGAKRLGERGAESLDEQVADRQRPAVPPMEKEQGPEVAPVEESSAPRPAPSPPPDERRPAKPPEDSE